MDTNPDLDALFEDIDTQTITENLADAQAMIWEICEKLGIETQSLDQAIVLIEDRIEDEV